MKRSGPMEAARPSGGLASLRETQFFIERLNVSNAETMPSHHYHNYYEFYYLYGGDRFYFIKDKTYHVKRGMFVLIKPYEIHSTINYGKSGYDRCLIMLKRSFVAELEALMSGVDLFGCFEKDIHLVSLSLQEQRFVEELLYSMNAEYRAKAPGHKAFLKTAVTQLLLIIARHGADTMDAEANGLRAAHKTVSKVAAYINNNYREAITLASISEQFFISPCYFSRIFTQVTGVSFNDYLNEVRVKEAQQLLMSTEKPVAEIAEMVGYKSSTHFGRKFGQIAGMTPGEYRRLKRGSGS